MDMVSTEPATDGRTAAGLGIGVTLAVRDLARCVAFYRDVIGLRVMERRDGWAGLGAAGGPVLLELLAVPGAAPDDPASAGLFHTAFLLPGRADLGRWLAHCARLGVPLDGASDHLVSEAAYLGDPEGNGIEVYADRPAAQWRWHGPAGARRVEMANRPFDAPGLVAAGAGAAWDGAPAGTVIGHVHLRVGELNDATRFYGGLLGLDVTADWPGATFLAAGPYHHHVGLNTWRSAGAGPRDPRCAGLAAVTFTAGTEAATLRDPWGTSVHVRPA